MYKVRAVKEFCPKIKRDVLLKVGGLISSNMMVGKAFDCSENCEQHSPYCLIGKLIVFEVKKK
jgi:hypothetical protein